jgi:hypothetical protein
MLHQASDNSSTLQRETGQLAVQSTIRLVRYPTQLTFERQIVTKVDLHKIFRTPRPTFRIVHDGFLANCKTDHGRIFRPIPESRRDSKLLEQDLLENVLGCPSTHCDRSAAALDPWPGNEVADGEVVGVVWVRWEKVEAGGRMGLAIC